MTIKRTCWWLFIALVAWVLLYQLWVLVHIWWWVDHNPSSSAFMRDRLAIIQQEKPNAHINQQWVAYPKISVHLKRALVASEDAKFVDHEGFDWEGMHKAWDKNIKKGKIVAGGSTISQQLAKNLFLSGQRTPWRKLEEAAITYMLENMLSKRRIFEIYLNMIEWGNGVFGAEAAARHYFNVSASGLTAAQAAKLAAMVPNPRYYDTHRNAKGLMRKTGIILHRMTVADIP